MFIPTKTCVSFCFDLIDVLSCHVAEPNLGSCRMSQHTRCVIHSAPRNITLFNLHWTNMYSSSDLY